MDNFALVATEVAILFALIGVGAALTRLKLVTADSVRALVNVLIMVVTPSIIIDSFQRDFDPSMLKQLALAFVIAALMHLVMIGIALALSRGDGRTLPVLRVATVFSNAGFMGIPLEYAILGSKGVFFGIVYVAMFNLFMWSWGLFEMTGGQCQPGWRWKLKMMINPGTVGLILGVPLFLLSVRLPGIVAEPVKMLANLNTPLAMIVIGHYLAGANLKQVLIRPAAWLSAGLRLIASPLLILLIFLPLRHFFDRTMMLALVTAASAPAGAMVAMFASKFDRDVELAVGLVSGTTILSILTMPIMIALAMELL